MARRSVVLNRVVAIFGQSAAVGALRALRAATDPWARGGDYFGPDGWLQLRGSPVAVRPTRRALDHDSAARLWAVSEESTGATWPTPPAWEAPSESEYFQSKKTNP